MACLSPSLAPTGKEYKGERVHSHRRHAGTDVMGASLGGRVQERLGAALIHWSRNSPEQQPGTRSFKGQ